MTELPVELYLRTFDAHDDIGTAEPPKTMKDVKTGQFTKPKPVKKPRTKKTK